MIRMIPRDWGAIRDLEALAASEGWRWSGETDHRDLGLAEAVWHAPSATRVAYLDDRFLDLQYIAIDGAAEEQVAARIAAEMAMHHAASLAALHAGAPGPAERAQSLLALSLMTGAEAAADDAARTDLAASDPAVRAAAVLAVSHVAPPDLRRLLQARRRVESHPMVMRRLDEVLGSLDAC